MLWKWGQLNLNAMALKQLHNMLKLPLTFIYSSLFHMQVCNNLNQCSCSVGFNGDACQSVFTGPGSGQPTRSELHNQIRYQGWQKWYGWCGICHTWISCSLAVAMSRSRLSIPLAASIATVMTDTVWLEHEANDSRLTLPRPLFSKY